MRSVKFRAESQHPLTFLAVGGCEIIEIKSDFIFDSLLFLSAAIHVLQFCIVGLPPYHPNLHPLFKYSHLISSGIKFSFLIKSKFLIFNNSL